jgi:hypothetical protein
VHRGLFLTAKDVEHTQKFSGGNKKRAGIIQRVVEKLLL